MALAYRMKWDKRAGVAANARRQLPPMVTAYFSSVREFLADDAPPRRLHRVRLASKRLRALDGVADARLLERSPRGVSPTAAGRELYVAARKLLAEVEVVEALMGSPTPREAPVRLAVSPTLAEFALPGPLVEFGRHYERQVPVELTVVNSLLVRELVRDGRAEF